MDEKVAKIVLGHNVFGRVKPEQKRQIAEFLQSVGRVVAMTGDGVNDALALKKADIGIAMESGSAATKSVAEIVLLDNDFAHLPDVLAEGRRVIANVERVANLFIVKNVFVAVLVVLTTAFGLSYPYLPIQMSLIDFFAIGLPAFFLALASNSRIYRPGFLARVLRFVVPTGALIALTMMLDYYLVHHRGMSLAVVGTSVSIITMAALLAVLTVLSRPFVWWKIVLIFASAAGFLIVLMTPLSRIFRYEFQPEMMLATVSMGVLAVAVVFATDFVNRKFREK
jgi:cation-transporting ATPase E